MPRTDVRIDTEGLNRILRRLPGNRSLVVRRVAFAVETQAKLKAPVDTGALRASIYTSIGRNAQAPPLMGDATRVELPTPEEDVAYVGPSVEYGVYQELGTSAMSAQPFLGPAVDAVRSDLEQFRGDFRRLAEGR